MLPGYVPKRGEYNETYMKITQEIVSKSAKYGIYTLLDMHQDVMSPKFCVEGFPDWAVNTGWLVSNMFNPRCLVVLCDKEIYCTTGILTNSYRDLVHFRG